MRYCTWAVDLSDRFGHSMNASCGRQTALKRRVAASGGGIQAQDYRSDDRTLDSGIFFLASFLTCRSSSSSFLP